MKKKKLNKIHDLFMDCNDKEALQELYKETKDPIVKILIVWNEEYMEELEDYNLPQYYMYGDIIGHIFDKYKLEKI